MLRKYYGRVTQIGNSKGVTLPKELASTLATTEVTLEQTPDGIKEKHFNQNNALQSCIIIEISFF